MSGQQTLANPLKRGVSRRVESEYLRFFSELGAHGNSRPDDGLEKALAEFHGKLTLDEKGRFRALQTVPDASSVLTLTAQLDQVRAARRRGHCVASRLSPLLTSIQQFSGVVSTFVSSNPTIAALVWGSVEFMLRLANNSFSYFDKLSSFLMSIERFCPRFAEYQALYFDAPALQSSLRSFYAEIVRCCTHVCEVLRKPDWSNIVRSSWVPFSADLGPFESKIKSLASDVKEEIRLAQARAWHAERKAQDVHRTSVARLFQRNEAESQKRSLRRTEEARLIQRRNLLDKLSTYDQRTAYRQSRLKCHPGTAEWFHDEPNFEIWRSSVESSTCCVIGKLGCGKTILLSNIIASLFAQNTTQHARIAYFFCRFNEESSLQAPTILRSIIRQCLQAETLPQDIDVALTDLLDQILIRTRDLLPVLRLVLSSFPMHYLVIDGTDECADSERRDLLQVLSRAMSACPTSVKLMLTSRNTFSGRSCPELIALREINVEESVIKGDIATFVDDRFREKQESGELVVGDPSLIIHIRSVLKEGAKSMFLWAALQLDEVFYQTCDEDLRKVINDLPATLEETYSRMFVRIANNRKTDLASKIFKWMAVGKRPLSLQELQDALAVEKFAEYSKPDRLILDIYNIIPWCQGLLVLDEIGDEVSFAHPTIKDTLTRIGKSQDHMRFTLEDADKDFGEICATYLNFNDFKTGLIKRDSTQDVTAEQILTASLAMNLGSKMTEPLFRYARSRHSGTKNETVVGKRLLQARAADLSSSARLKGRSFPFLAYASGYWLSHSSLFSEEDRIWRPWRSLVLTENDLSSKPWTPTEWVDREESVLQFIGSTGHVALLSLVQASTRPLSPTKLKRIVDSAAESDRMDFARQVWSIEGLDYTVSEMLLLGAKYGIMALVEECLSAAEHQSDRTQAAYIAALETAVTRGHLRVAERIFATVFDGFHALDGRVALQVSRNWGDPFIVDLIIAAEADVDFITSSGWCALHFAAKEGSVTTVGKLLSAQASVDARTAGSSETALHVVVDSGALDSDDARAAHNKVFSLLLAAGADINAVTASGQTALHIASNNGSYRTLDKLLASGAAVEVRTADSDKTALQLAAERGFVEIVVRLLDANADPNTLAGSSGRTVLQLAAGEGHLATVKLLLFDDTEAEINAVAAGSHGRTALQAASEGGYSEVVRTLIAVGADVNAAPAPDNGRTALQAASGRGHLDIVKQLVSAGSNINADRAAINGRTAMEAAAENGHSAVLDFLIAKGGYVHAFDLDRWTGTGPGHYD